MEHDRARELFSRFVDGELTDDERRELQAHLQQCETCRQELDKLRDTMQSLSGLHRLAPPPEFARKVERRIHRRSRGRFFGPESLLHRLPFEWISFIIIMVLLAIYLLLSFDPRQIKPRPGSDAPAPTAPAGAKGAAATEPAPRN